MAPEGQLSYTHILHLTGVKIRLLPCDYRNQLHILDCHWHKQHPKDVGVAHLSQSHHNLQTEETKVSDLKMSRQISIK